MNDKERNRHVRNEQVMHFGIDNQDDFRTGPGAEMFALVAACYNNAAAKHAAYTLRYGESGQDFQVKSNNRERLRELMSRMALAARSMVYAHPGITEIYRMTRNMNDADLLARARAMYNASAELEQVFISYELPADFREQLRTSIDEFEASFGPPTSAMGDRAAARTEYADEINRGARAVRILDGIVRNKYHGNPGKLAAWARASHVERAAKKKDGGDKGGTPPTP